MTRDVAIVGAGYVGVPLARTFADAGKRVLLVDVDEARVAQLNRGESYIEDVPSDVLRPLVEQDLVAATTDYDELREVDAILVALPTPLSRQREPDLHGARVVLERAQALEPTNGYFVSLLLDVLDAQGDTQARVDTLAWAWWKGAPVERWLPDGPPIQRPAATDLDKTERGTRLAFEVASRPDIRSGERAPALAGR